MKKALLTVIALVSTSSLFAFDFRNTSWFMTKDQVIDSESDRNYSQKDNNGNISINYQIFLNGHQGLLIYAFQDNQLTAGYYIFEDKPDKQTYQDMHEVLVAKYGKPDRDAANDSEWNLKRSVISVFHKEGSCVVAFLEHSAGLQMLKDTQTQNEKNF